MYNLSLLKKVSKMSDIAQQIWATSDLFENIQNINIDIFNSVLPNSLYMQYWQNVNNSKLKIRQLQMYNAIGLKMLEPLQVISLDGKPNTIFKYWLPSINIFKEYPLAGIPFSYWPKFNDPNCINNYNHLQYVSSILDNNYVSQWTFPSRGIELHKKEEITNTCFLYYCPYTIHLFEKEFQRDLPFEQLNDTPCNVFMPIHMLEWANNYLFMVKKAKSDDLNDLDIDEYIELRKSL